MAGAFGNMNKRVRMKPLSLELRQGCFEFLEGKLLIQPVHGFLPLWKGS